MKKLVFTALSMLSLVLFVNGEDKLGKEITLKGEINCSKCTLNETPDCGHAIKVSENGKQVVYFFKDKGKGEPYHDTVCNGPAKGLVKGIVSEKDGKKFITPTKGSVKFD